MGESTSELMMERVKEGASKIRGRASTKPSKKGPSKKGASKYGTGQKRESDRQGKRGNEDTRKASKGSITIFRREKALRT